MAEYEDTYEKVMELARRRGFVWPSSEIYGSVAGFIDYGPLGAMLKRRIENIWRNFYVVQEGYYEIECPTVGIEPIYVASGHVGGFSDKMFQCPHCQEFLRADHVAEAFGIPHAGTMSKEELHDVLLDKECPACGKVLGDVEVFDFNLMFTTSIGPATPATAMAPRQATFSGRKEEQTPSAIHAQTPIRPAASSGLPKPRKDLGAMVRLRSMAATFRIMITR